MEYLLFFIWFSIMLTCLLKIMFAHKSLQDVMKKHQLD